MQKLVTFSLANCWINALNVTLFYIKPNRRVQQSANAELRTDKVQHDSETDAPSFPFLFRSHLLSFFQMWARWRVWRTTGAGICCTGPATPPQQSPATLWIRAAGEPWTGTPWLPCLETITHELLSLTSVRGQIWFCSFIQ